MTVTVDPPTCDEDLQPEVESNAYCGLIGDSSDVFRSCIAAADSNYAGFKDNCVYDVCAANPDTDAMHEAACKSLEVFASHCEGLGYTVDWRAAAGCGKLS